MTPPTEITSPSQIHLDLDQMPKYRRDALSRFVLDLVDKVFSVPGEEEKYQEWLKARKENDER